jgi:protein O-GlcNAc transferase
MSPASGMAFDTLLASVRALARERRFADAIALIDEAAAKRSQERDKLLLLKLDIALAAKDDAATISAERSLAALVDAQPQSLVRIIASLRLRKRTNAAWIILSRSEPAPALAPEAFLLGVVFAREGEKGLARTCYEFALEAKPNFIEAHVNLGDLLLGEREFLRAQPHFEAAIGIDVGNGNAWLGLGQCLLNTGKGAHALDAFSRAPAALENSPMLTAWRATATLQSGDEAQAVILYERALAGDPACFSALFGYASVCERRGDLDTAAQLYARAHAAQPESVWALNNQVFCLRRMAAWEAMAVPEAELVERLRRGDIGDYGTSSWVSLDLPGTTLREVAAVFARTQSALRVRPVAHRDFAVNTTQRLRVGYVSADFRSHATSYLLVDVLERHDRDRFEVFAYALTPSDGSAVAARVAAACSHFIDVANLPPEQVASRILDDRVDVLVDLNGHTQGECMGLVALRPAPVIASYLGYPGSMGAFVDYVIGDRQVTPVDAADEFSEKIVRLPRSYQPNDSRREIGAETTRAAHGLPDDAIVACSFNQSWKFTAPIWAIWMRLLRAHPRLVLWLLDENPWATANLRRHAEAAGVAPERIVFAPRVPHADHLARLGLADIALDTVPCNSHTTGSDALWMGVPLVTLVGQAFIGRVGASLLDAVGLPELIAHSEAEYAALLDDLIGASFKLATLRIRLLSSRQTAALFDSEATTRALEAAYAAMYARYRGGHDPVAIDIAAANEADGRSRIIATDHEGEA